MILEIDIALPTDSLLFDYSFTAASEGAFSAYFDNELVSLVYEEFSPLGTLSSGVIQFDELLSIGSHILALRLDVDDSVPSIVNVSNIRTGLLTSIPEPTSSAIAILSAIAYGICRRTKASRHLFEPIGSCKYEGTYKQAH